MAADPTLTPAQIAADAKNLFHNIKEALKRQKPWEQDVESQRQKLRRLHLSLLFSFPYAKESKDADTQLWMATSHSVITVYKALLASLDRERERSSGAKNHVVERRRLTQRFRQFLTEEDRFWTAFIVRYVRDFGLKDATISLSALEISDDTNDDNDPEASTKSNRRYQFPEPPSTPPETPNRRDQSLDIVYKALVCLGDIARYREQYSERAKPEQTRRGRNSKGPPPAPRVPNYGRAQDAYEQARLLVPENGNASHQLAILCNYQKDVFGATYHYYRAFCVKHPYETAAENMHITLHKALDSYMRREGRADEEHNVSLPSHVALERLKEKVVVLHASWRLPSEEANKKLPEFSLAVTTSFTSLISERILPVEVISRTLVMSFGALWKVKMLRDDHGKKEKETKRHYATEIHIAPHVLSLMTCLLRVGVLQLTDSTITSTANPSVPIDLAQNITAVFRRTLPALRISNKWVQANISYVASIAGKPNSNASLKEQVQDFWVAYQAFFTNLYRVFPVSKLPSLAAPLEEDVDMAGFLPLKHTMGELSTKSSSGLVPGQSQVHPNEEHLMRISDLIEDAISIAQNEKSPIMFDDGKFLFKQAAQHLSPKRPQSEIPPSKVAVKSDHGLMVPPSVAAKAIRQRVESRTVPALPTKDETEDDNVTVSTRTEDDPVNLAMNAVLDSDVSDTGTEEDEVVYPKQVTGTPSQPAHPSPLSPRSLPHPVRYSNSPALGRGLHFQQSHSMAQDIVNNALGFRRTSFDAPRNSPPAPLLFGSSAQNALTSIWSTSHDYESPVLANKNIGSPLLPPSPTAPVWNQYGYENRQNSPFQSFHNAEDHTGSPKHYHSYAPGASSGLSESQSFPSLGALRYQEQPRIYAEHSSLRRESVGSGNDDQILRSPFHSYSQPISRPWAPP